MRGIRRTCVSEGRDGGGKQSTADQVGKGATLPTTCLLHLLPPVADTPRSLLPSLVIAQGKIVAAKADWQVLMAFSGTEIPSHLRGHLGPL